MPRSEPAVRPRLPAFEAAGLPGRPPLRRVLQRLLAWQQRSSERAHLAGLDARLRRDLGLSESDVAAELRKPFWRP
jgi:uncharacterized protein YjiS (DUF1127 family)